jgi:catechol 2,3-dioxygenase-like lactoylglutathione lyase family enzyme
VFDHVTIRVSDVAASDRFYDTVLATLGVERSYDADGFSEWDDFSLSPADDSRGVTRQLHVAFAAPSREQVDAFWQGGVDAGFADDGPPGERPQYRPDYYGAFLLDPDGNSAEAVVHGQLRRDGIIDHLWIRVSDLEESKRFYETIAEPAGLRLRRDLPERVQFTTAGGNVGGSFSLVPGEPTENLHMAFPALDDGVVDAFYMAALRAGYASIGPPGERPQYHPGYYAAYVSDPDGNNIEVVNHHRLAA